MYIVNESMWFNFSYLFGFMFVNLFLLYSTNLRNISYLRIQDDYEQLAAQIGKEK